MVEGGALHAISHARNDADNRLPLRTLDSTRCRQSFACRKTQIKSSIFRPIPTVIKQYLNSMQNSNPKNYKTKTNSNKTVFSKFPNSNETVFEQCFSVKIMFEYCSNAVLVTVSFFCKFPITFFNTVCILFQDCLKKWSNIVLML